MKQIFELTEEDIKAAIRTHVAQAQGVSVKEVYISMHVMAGDDPRERSYVSARVEADDLVKPKFEGTVPRD